MHAIVIGAEIGGLTAAAALHKRNIEITVLEQARELKGIGAGLQLSATGMKVMRWLGLECAIKECSVYGRAYE
jgi:salicylate hydroxylase